MLIVIDNYDSFTYNLVHYLGELGLNNKDYQHDIKVIRNDELASEDIITLNPFAIILSPGPCTPNEAGICLDLITKASPKTPIFGVCLGMQAIGQAFGGIIEHAPQLMHGKTSEIIHQDNSVFAGLTSPLMATRYHSLSINNNSLPSCLIKTAWTEDDIIMGVMHETLPVHGVQFHPESIRTEYGHDMLANFLALALKWHQTT